MEKQDRSDEPVVLFKYGGNAMSDENLKREVLRRICSLRDKGYRVVITHGGGPFIKKALEEAKIESEFIDGHRKTTQRAYEYVEMTLKGKVNSNLVSIINAMGYSAVGLSGQDGRSVFAAKRLHKRMVDGKEELVDLGQVGDVASVNTTLLQLLLDHGFIPVISCTATDEKGVGYNINGDMFAGHIAGALGVDQFVVLTDVDGLRRDKDDPESLIREVSLEEINSLEEQGIIQGGMIPKMDSCEIALTRGAASARIINGTEPEQIARMADREAVGTVITS